MATTAERKQTTSTVKDKPVSAAKSLKKVDTQKQQPEEETQSDRAYSQWVAEAAYYKAEERSFEPGFEEEDWLLAEEEYKHIEKDT